MILTLFFPLQEKLKNHLETNPKHSDIMAHIIKAYKQGNVPSIVGTHFHSHSRGERDHSNSVSRYVVFLLRSGEHFVIHNA